MNDIWILLWNSLKSHLSSQTDENYQEFQVINLRIFF